MKRISLILLLWTASVGMAVADDTAIEQYIQAQISVLKAQVGQRQLEVSSRKEATSDAGGFAAINAAMTKAGFTTMQFYQFKADHETAIVEWLQNHPAQANQIEALTDKHEQLIEEYDRQQKGAGQ